MARTEGKTKLLRGRPKLYSVKRCIGLSEADHHLLCNLGGGSVTAGIRRAAELIRTFDLH